MDLSHFPHLLAEQDFANLKNIFQGEERRNKVKSRQSLKPTLQKVAWDPWKIMKRTFSIKTFSPSLVLSSLPFHHSFLNHLMLASDPTSLSEFLTAAVRPELT
jgi:hypothetical protein